jgi:peptidyl-prolyl cis-trans isomerase C
MKRPFALLIAIVTVAALGGCGSNGASSTLNDAATMSYTLKGNARTLHVSRAGLLSEVRTLVDSKEFETFLAKQTPPFKVSHDLSADTKLTAIWLSQLIHQAALDELFATRHLHVTAAVRTKAATDAAFPDPTIFKTFSQQFKTTMTDRTARTEALIASYTDTSDAAGQAYLKSHASQFACASGKNVAHILVKTQAEAQAIVDQLASGASFATLAKQDSTDTQSAAKGGSLGCLAAGEFVTEFQKAAEAATIGTPTAPVHTSFGYHVILVTKATAVQYADVRTQVVQALRQQGSQNLTTALNALLKQLRVHIDPRFGTWGTVTNAQGQSSYQVTAPKAPTPATSREGTTTTTVPAAATGSP